MSPIIVLILCCHLTYLINGEVSYENNRHLRSLSVIPIQGAVKQLNTSEEKSKEPEKVVDIGNEKKDEAQPSPKKETPAETKKKNTTHTTDKNETIKIIDHKVLFKSTEMESGALLRGVSVVVVLTALVLVYMAVKTYCGKRGKQTVMVSKYGVRTRRSDLEMTPLPLDDDEEDETLFEVSNTNR